MPRFVILEHDHPLLHWDLMLESGPALRTWRLAQPPAPGVEIAAIALGDHRLAYLDYEGPVSGGRGTVRRWDAGDYVMTMSSADEVAVTLRGSRRRGRARLRRGAEAWQFLLECDAASSAV